MRRVNTASSFFKRLLSRSDSQTQPSQATAENGPQLVVSGNSSKIPKSASNTSLAGSKVLPVPGRITDQVIEEVDEQLTITSMRQEIRPRADDLFNQGPIAPTTGPPPASKPVDVPMRPLGASSNAYNRGYSTVGQNLHDNYGEKDEFVSCSAPTTRFRPATPQGYDEYDQEARDGAEGNTSSGEADDKDKGDDFEKLRLARERERIERQRLNIARSISTTQGSTTTNLNVDLAEALAASISDDLNQSGA